MDVSCLVSPGRFNCSWFVGRRAVQTNCWKDADTSFDKELLSAPNEAWTPREALAFEPPCNGPNGWQPQRRTSSS